MDRLWVFDTETSGLGASAGVCEAAVIEIDDDMQILNQYRSLLNPGCEISVSATAIHDITDDMVKDCPTIEQWFETNFPNLKNEHVLMVAHNAPFDAKFLAPHVGKLESLCTLKLARRAWPECPDHKLRTLMYYLKLQKLGSHSALDDTTTCLGVLKLACEKLGLTLEDAYHMLRKPTEVTHMPFGKEWKGKPLCEVSDSFMNWCLNLKDLDADLRYSIEKEMAKRNKARRRI
jgi:DNA polymerase III epsilon subunit-like protein